MGEPLTYKDIFMGACALLMFFVGMSVRELITLLRQILARQRECPALYADRERNDKAHKEFYDEMENLNVRVSLLEQERAPRCGGDEK